MKLNYDYGYNKVADTLDLIDCLLKNAEDKRITVCLPSSGRTFVPEDMHLLESAIGSEAIIIKATTQISSFVPCSEDPSGYKPMKLITAGMIEDDVTDFLPKNQVKAAFEPSSPKKPRVPIKDYSYVDADRILRELF